MEVPLCSQVFIRRFLTTCKRSVQRLLVFCVVSAMVMADVSLFINGHTIARVQAAMGDFSVWRNASDVSTVDSSGIPLDVVWDTPVVANSNITLTGSTDIDLSEGGKYLVLYNVWTEEGAAGGTNRRSLHSFLTLNGSELPYGRGAGYIRDTDGDLAAYNSGGAIIDASNGDDLQIEIKRDDTNAADATDIQAGTNGVSVLKLDDNADYLRVYKDTRSASISGNTAFTPVVWDTSDEVDTGSFLFTDGSSDVTLIGDAGTHFLITANVSLNQDVNQSIRQNYEMQVELDGLAVPGTRVTTYPRGNPNSTGIFNGTLAYTGIVTKTDSADQTLTIDVRRESIGNSATDIVANETGLTIMKMPSMASVISLTSTSTGQALQTTQTALQFNEQITVDEAAFAHSTTTDNSRIEIDLDGDYLFFSTTHASRTVRTNGNRAVPLIEWRTDGTNTYTYGGHGSFNRGDQSTTDSYTSGSSGGVILDGLTDTQYVEVTAYDELNNTTQTDFWPNLISVQGVELASLFATDVTVSATGTQATTVPLDAVDKSLGGSFIITEAGTNRNITSITFTESGTIDGQTGIDNIELYYDLDTTAPYDCFGESYGGAETQFGSTDTTGFSAPDGASAFSDTVLIGATQSFCGYIVYDTTGTTADGETINISIADPSTDVVVTGGGTVGPGSGVSPTGVTTVRDAELDQLHYHWRNDDGSETTATSVTVTEDTAASGFSNGTIRRLRMLVDATGSTSSVPINYRLEYGQNMTTCEAVTMWTDVGTGGSGDWDVVDSPNVTDGTNTTNISVASGGVSDPGGASFLVSNGAVKDTSSETAAITINSAEFVELEFAIEPTLNASQGNSYCFRLTDAGTPLRNYTVYPEATISADVLVSAEGGQTATTPIGTTGFHIGGAFVFTVGFGTREITDVTFTESGSIDAQNDLDNIALYYDLDTSAPYDCVGETYAGTEPQFGTTDTDGFSGVNGSSTFSGSVNIDSTTTMCGYLVLDIASGVANGETLTVSIADPTMDVVTAAGSVGPSSPISPSGDTTISGPILTQTHYHWRNDDGSETAATSQTAGSEDVALFSAQKNETQRLRVQVHNAGAVDASAANFRLEYGTRVTTCDAVGTWIDVGAVGGAFDVSDSVNLTDGDDTTNIAVSAGGTTDPGGGSFETPNGAVKDTASETGAITLAASEFVEIEYAIEATADAGDSTTYCFRVTDAGTNLQAYDIYPEISTREKQDYVIQRGTVMVTGTGVTMTAGVDYTAPSSASSAFVRITNSQMTGAGNNTGGGNQDTDDFTAYISNPENITTSFDITRPPSAAGNTRVDWEIIEFVGIAGTDNEMIVRDVGTVTYGVNDLIATGTVVAGVADDTDVVVYITGQLNPAANRSNVNDGLSTAQWSSGTSEPVFTRGDADSIAAQLSYAVVEYTGANWSVQRVEHQYTAAGVAETESITPVGSLDRAFVHAQKRVGNGLQGLDEAAHQVFLSGIGQVSYQLRAGANTPADHYSVAWVIENTQTGTGAMDVHRVSGTVAAGGGEPESNLVSITAIVKMDNASLWVSNDTSGGGTAFPRHVLGATVTSTTQFELWNSDTGQSQDYRAEVVEWPTAEIAVRQNYFRIYADNDTLTPTDPWPAGAADLSENASITVLDEPPGETAVLRLRMTLNVNNATLPENTESFKLQHGRRVTTCSAIGTWEDVGTTGSGSIWRGFDGTPADGDTLPSTLISVSDEAGTYEEENGSAVNPNAVSIGEDIEYDWVIQHNGAIEKTDYCFRMVYNDDTELTDYNNYPVVRTAGYGPVVNNWRFYDDETNLTPSTPLAAEVTAPSGIDYGDVFKLRVGLDEVAGASGNNIKFKVQYSEYVDFSDGGTDVTSTSTCTATSTWCYADGAGTDGATVDGVVLSTTDSCIGGSGNGCGTHNESPDMLITGHTHTALSEAEFEFTMTHAGARAGAVYYFRLYDTSNDEVVLASSSPPSVTAAGASLTFTVDGVLPSVTTEGVVTDATSTPSGINYGILPFDTEFEAAHRLTVDTNATEGYQVLLFTDQLLTNSQGNEISAVTSDNSTPIGWGAACDPVAASCFGYHTGDDTLQFGSARFAADDSYAALSVSTPEEIMYSSTPATDTHDVVYKIEVTRDQPTGIYEANINYVAIPVF